MYIALFCKCTAVAEVHSCVSDMKTKEHGLCGDTRIVNLNETFRNLFIPWMLYFLQTGTFNLTKRIIMKSILMVLAYLVEVYWFCIV